MISTYVSVGGSADELVTENGAEVVGLPLVGEAVRHSALLPIGLYELGDANSLGQRFSRPGCKEFSLNSQ
ncbi:hypothetical protein ACFFMN_32380 [Planobispora siamensis]|uniref:hypothetical protein n=1 Tax=Planobispora siamensis TaxID=936338 RepID=UPI00195238E9|nr:hypothetical protein [Planobispora siamensis]